MILHRSIVKLLLLILSFSFAYSTVLADTADEDFQKGIELYNNGDYVGAIGQFSELIEKGYRQSEVCYNLGCAYFKTGNLGRAILNFNRALEMNPSDEDARLNLEYARNFTVDRIEEPERGLLVGIVNGVVNMFDINTGLMISAGLLWITSAAAIFIIWFRWSGGPAVYILTILLILFSASSIVSGYHIKRDISTREGVLINKQADIRTGPGEDFSLQFTAHEGLEFEIEDNRDGYWRIKLKNGLKGWIEEGAVGIV
jgi:tetratricopeptide (TPR) repeat protein